MQRWQLYWKFINYRQRLGQPGCWELGLCVQETPLEGRRLSCFQTGALGENHNMILQVSSFCRGYRVVRVHNSVGITLQWKQVSSLYSLQMVTVLGSGLLFKSNDECMLV